jgi:hypothetical protein
MMFNVAVAWNENWNKSFFFLNTAVPTRHSTKFTVPIQCEAFRDVGLKKESKFSRFSLVVYLLINVCKVSRWPMINKTDQQFFERTAVLAAQAFRGMRDCLLAGFTSQISAIDGDKTQDMAPSPCLVRLITDSR